MDDRLGGTIAPGFARNRCLLIQGEREFQTEFPAGGSLTNCRKREPGGQSRDPVDKIGLGTERGADGWAVNAAAELDVHILSLLASLA